MRPSPVQGPGPECGNEAKCICGWQSTSVTCHCWIVTNTNKSVPEVHSLHRKTIERETVTCQQGFNLMVFGRSGLDCDIVLPVMNEVRSLQQQTWRTSHSSMSTSILSASVLPPAGVQSSTYLYLSFFTQEGMCHCSAWERIQALHKLSALGFATCSWPCLNVIYAFWVHHSKQYNGATQEHTEQPTQIVFAGNVAQNL